MATMKVDCGCCNGGTKPFLTAEGHRIPCPYCKDTGKRDVRIPHESHNMGEWGTEVRCPGDEPRFYGVRTCLKCGKEELRHAAGHFLYELILPCK